MNRWRSFLSQACAIILGLVFLTAAFSKIGDLEAFHQSLGRIAFLPFWLQGLAVLTIPGLELVIGLSLLLPAYRREGALLAVGLLVLFLILGIILNTTGHASDCGCFKITLPTWLNLSGWWIVARNLLFLLMAGLAGRKNTPAAPAKSPRQSGLPA
jgi:triosephosphate isomerase